MSDEVAIRALQAADYEVWLPLWQAYQEFYDAEIPRETTRVTWARMLDPREPVFGALAFAKKRAVGMVHWLYHRTCWTIGNNCYLQDLFVAPERRGRGIGRKLIEHVYAGARIGGCAKVYWLTHETNANAMLLYDRIATRTGFVHYERMLK